MALKVSKKTSFVPQGSASPVFCRHECPEGLLLSLLLQPRASRNAFVGLHDGKLKICLAAPPVDNQANEALCRFLAKAFHVSKTDVQLLSGQASRHKKVLVCGPYAPLLVRLQQLLSETPSPDFHL